MTPSIEEQMKTYVSLVFIYYAHAESMQEYENIIISMMHAFSQRGMLRRIYSIGIIYVYLIYIDASAIT